MTYCVGLKLKRGLVFMADTRTNAGMDNVSSFRKLYTWQQPGERFLMLMAAGNLATTQAVVSLLDERDKAPAERHGSLLSVESIFQAARLVADTLRTVIQSMNPAGPLADSPFAASFILGGQVKGGAMRLFLIYPQGNFIEAGWDTPFFQIGETKYGKPIIVRAYDAAMTFPEVVKLLMVSFDSTLKANLSVGLPLDLQVYEADTFRAGLAWRIERDDAYFRSISDGWSDALKRAFVSLPDFEWPAGRAPDAPAVAAGPAAPRPTLDVDDPEQDAADPPGDP